ncbi:hypothetical protein [Cryptosporidium parvum Iowa II]|uniref:NTF2 domain-containing protein n=2 Tax=Cryptosporidium parvum TaxID=5807 RepID=Q5CYT5_CRYPI|nr:hypothetical protein [Cryptosporidium parvum Iowa II]EAK90579.1 hypothetical protein cgd7_1090 [Cryptosporidium parvum Iowa II]QOY40422.1 Nuclear transport factor 2 domain containing protein [Cryptosporidium parvum]WKS78790.1 hypothetical protein CPCDC_7g1090 [Cryptosporidium sp. 43IA8]WRK33275.1 Nuclear transport factor 2 domain containing protein [Cryptosporidium parvum]|eukprot:QOY40422.1 hypothetical protein CPATCC_003268 [Cryptosporidium parvum]
MVSSRSASPNRRGSTGSSSISSINTRIVPFISNYYSLLGDSPNSLIDLHVSNPDPHLKWQIPSFIIGGNPRLQGSTIIDNGIISIKSFGKDTLHNLFSSLPTITCKIPVEIMDINETTENIVTVSIHGYVISGIERLLFFQVLQLFHQIDLNNKDNFLIFNNIFYVFPIPFDMKSIRSLQTFSNQHSISHSFSLAHTPKSTGSEDYDNNTNEIGHETTGNHSHNLSYQQQHQHSTHQQNHHVKTFPTYQDSKKTTKIKPQIKIHGLSANSGLSDKDILSAVSFQLKNSNEGFAIAINRNNDEAIIQVDSVQSQELLSQRGIYIQGLKYKVSNVVKKSNSGIKGNRNSNKNNNQAEVSGPSSSSAPKKMNSHKKESIPDKDGWITVTSKGKSKSKTF